MTFSRGKNMKSKSVNTERTFTAKHKIQGKNRTMSATKKKKKNKRKNNTAFLPRHRSTPNGSLFSPFIFHSKFISRGARCSGPVERLILGLLMMEIPICKMWNLWQLRCHRVFSIFIKSCSSYSVSCCLWTSVFLAETSGKNPILLFSASSVKNKSHWAKKRVQTKFCTRIAGPAFRHLPKNYGATLLPNPATGFTLNSISFY